MSDSHSIDKLIEAIAAETQWICSDEFRDNIKDKDLKEDGVLRTAIINILHLASDYNLDITNLLRSAALGYYYQIDPIKRNNVKSLLIFGMGNDADY